MREPAVAGQFYPNGKSELIDEISQCFKSPLGPGDAESPKTVEKRTIIGAIAPHAGYVYSGPVAAHLYRKLWSQEMPSTIVVLGPNHTGYGAGLAITTEDFKTPLGVVKIDDELVARLIGDKFINDYVAHAYEHSIEVQLPFIQFLGWSSKLVPICVGIHEYDELRDAGRQLRKAIQGREDVLVIASSDMSHYVPAKVAKELDGKAINAILALDSEKLYDTIFSNNITMCGFGPTIMMMEAVEGSKATLLKYGTSGDVHPMRDVVGYASVIVER